MSTVEIKSPIPVLAQQKSKPIKTCGKSQENFSKTNGKRLGIGFLSSTQKCSAVLNLQLISRFPDFLHSGVKKVRTKPEKKPKSIPKNGKTMNSGQNNGNQGNTHKTNGKKLGIEFLSSTKQHSAAHSAVLNLQPISRFPDFLHSGVKK